MTIPSSVTSIGYGTFEGCSGLTSVTIPSSVTSIAEGAFGECDGLKTIHVGKGGDINAVRQMLRESGFDVEGVTFDYVEIPILNYCTVTFDANGGLAERATATVARYSAIGTLPTATREGYEFLGWFTAAVGGTQVTASTKVTGNVTFYAQWQKIGGEEDPASPPVEPPDEPVGPTTPTNAPPTVVDEAETHVDVEKGEVAPFETAAAVYDGFLYEGEKVIGSVQVKVAKMKNGSAKVTAAVQMAGQSKKISFKGGVADATGAVTDMTDKDGNKLAVTVGVNGLGGEFRRSRSDTPYRIDGARNVFRGKSDADKTAAGDAARLYQTSYGLSKEVFSFL